MAHVSEAVQKRGSKNRNKLDVNPNRIPEKLLQPFDNRKQDCGHLALQQKPRVTLSLAVHHTTSRQ